MSTNELNFDKSNQMLQAERNCVNFDGTKRFNVNYKAMSHDDKCFVDIQTRQSIGPGNYGITNYFDCECMIPQTVKNATDNVTVPYKNGYGTEQACVVDDGSSIRIGLQRRYPKCPQQLFTRPYLCTPLMAKGVFNCDGDSELKFSEDTKIKRSCNTLSGISIPHVFTSQIDHISWNIQNPTHLIQEYNDPAWRRGGNNSRNIIRSYDYSSRCGKAYMQRSTNPDFWDGKSMLLNQ